MIKEKKNDLMEKIVSLCKRRGFVFPGSEIYGGFAGAYDYGPLGVALKNNLKDLNIETIFGKKIKPDDKILNKLWKK